MSKKLQIIILDYDLAREEVEEDAKRLSEAYELGPYNIKPSKSGNYHVEFPLRTFNNFLEAYQIALDSKADRDWLHFCEEHGFFALAPRESYMPLEKRKTSTAKTEPKAEITLPILLHIVPKDTMNLKRLIGLCESMREKDASWQYKMEQRIDMKTHIIIGCKDEAQAKRRLKMLNRTGIEFEVKTP